MFTKEMSIGEALQVDPKVVEVFNKYHMGCFSCMGAMAESIENGALMHGIDLDTLMTDLNNLLKK
ncbi:MAG: DUF1858 domain-containing protein [Candidatus Schekmanbacteria bacterium]|nr:DUF1858 domain-containing protein [Candidatus Schekmanbacteria bacterium]